ncbi:MAG: cupin domain-containing protein [Crocinitomicaceae bacterium]|nr:cupin domain-containing protein [Crocinitomicaceae bacterium]
MQERINELIKRFDMQAHPEGGYYSEEYRSEMTLPNMERQLTTSIYFLLPSEHVSHFHRIKSDELWFFHEGSPLTVHTLDEHGHGEHLVGLDLKAGQTPQFLVPADTIFGSSVNEANSYSFVSCVVAPGFDFRDFELFTSEELLKNYSEFEEVIRRMTVS